MYLVVADDLTGAAEIGGVAWRYGLTAEVQLSRVTDTAADVTVIDTDTRSLTDADAAKCVRDLGAKLRGQPLFKKVDSVLRGPVVTEIRALLEGTGLRRALLVPCNPSLGRTITDGQYWIGGVPINQTDFSKDPGHPVRSAFVNQMLHAPEVGVLSVGSPLSEAGVFVGEAASEADVKAWAGRLDGATLAVGAASFFAAMLERDGLRPASHRKSAEPRRVLLISGSASEHSRLQIEEMRLRGIPVFTMLDSLYIVDALQASSRVVIKTRLNSQLVRVVEEVLGRVRVDQLWVEGGATASALMRRLSWDRFQVREELAPGVVSLQPVDFEAPAVVLKPGSYRWASL